MTDKQKYIVKREVPAVMETLLGLPTGRPITVSCKEFAPYSSVQSTMSRLNKKAGRAEFSVTSTDNGATYTMIRK